MAKKPAPEDAFYDNLTLGLIKTLANMPRVCNVSCEKRQPCDKAQLVNWEQRHGVYLPEDMKKFYLSTDGFLLQWSYQYSPSDIRRVGYIQFPHLMQITLLRENLDSTLLSQFTEQPNHNSLQLSSAASSKDRWGHDTPVLTPKSKIFEISNINDVAKVCMVYESTVSNYPHIYLLELDSFKWQFLAETFSEYLRMSIGHLGLPYWELCFASCGLPSWTEQLFLLLAPHLLEEHEPRRSRIINPVPEHPSNVIDPTIFRAKPKGTAKLSAAGKHK